MTKIEIVEMPKPAAIFAAQLFRRGVEYLDAFDDLTGEGKPLRHFAGYFLYAHAIELLLKSYLAGKGVTHQMLIRKYSHDLAVTYKACVTHQIPEVRNLGAFAHHFRMMNNRNDLRYPTDYRLSFPRPHDCMEVAHALVAVIGPSINAEAIKAQIQFASSTRHLRGKARIRWTDARERRSALQIAHDNDAGILERFPISLHRILLWRSSSRTRRASRGLRCGRWCSRDRGLCALPPCAGAL